MKGLFTEYEVVKAKSSEEAVQKSEWKIGDRAECVGLNAMGNNDGTYTVVPKFERVEKEDGS